MVEERKSMFNINTLFGIAIGAILAYLLLKNNQEVIIVRSQKQESHILNWQPLKDIPSVDKLHYNTHQVQTEQSDTSEEPKAVNKHVQEQLDTSEEPKAASEHVQEQSNTLEESKVASEHVQEQSDTLEEPKTVNEHVQEQSDTSEELETTYKNDERWKISRDSNGDITEIKVVRNAKVK